MLYNNYEHLIYTNPQVVSYGSSSYEIMSVQLIQKNWSYFSVLLEIKARDSFHLDIFKQKLFCYYGSEIYVASIIIDFSKSFFCKIPKIINGCVSVECQCVELVPEIQFHAGDVYWDFLIPNIQVEESEETVQIKNGSFIGDCYKFQIKQREWMFKRIFEYKGAFYLAEELPLISDASISSHSVLRVSAKDFLIEDALEVALKICRLLQLSCLSYMGIVQVQRTSKRGSQIVSIDRNLPFTQGGIDPILPISGRYGFKLFIEAAYPIFEKDEAWWSRTLGWIGSMGSNSAVDLKSATLCMLVERIANKVLQDNNMLKCKHSYNDKVKDVCSLFKLDEPSNLKKMRNELLHEGNRLAEVNLNDFWKQILIFVASILFKMLGHESGFSKKIIKKENILKYFVI